LNQTLARCVKPYLQYYSQAKVAEVSRARMMHLVGVDVLIDQQDQAWLLETNSTPSMGIEFNAGKESDSGQGPISGVDFFVKSQ
jgi:hypothetical protein